MFCESDVFYGHLYCCNSHQLSVNLKITLTSLKINLISSLENEKNKTKQKKLKKKKNSGRTLAESELTPLNIY